jgi:SAM-dependent methyltransferase
MKHSLQTGSATLWGPLWGARPDDWARSEEQQLPAYLEVLDRLDLPQGARILDVGCGAGAFLRAAADRGLQTTGIDAAEALLALARARVPEADLAHGDMEELPYGDDTFDAVAGLTSFFFAADLVGALREAGRVAQRGAPVVIGVWGRPERCDIEAVKRVIRPFLPGGSTEPPSFWRPGVLEDLARRADLEPRDAFDVSLPYLYREESVGRELLAPAGLATLVGREREAEVAARITEALAPYRTGDGAVRLENEFHHLVALAPGHA